MKKVFIYGTAEGLPNYLNAMEKSGSRVTFGKSIAEAFGCDALLLPGGADVNPSLYAEDNTASEDLNDLRDAAELELIAYFTEQNKPIFGICRGLQILNVAFGGSLIQHIEQADRHSRGNSSTDQVHPIKLSCESFLTTLYGDTFMVNSAHHQAIKIPASDFEIIAYSDDGIVEAIVHKTKPIFAVQWHPERMAFSHHRTDTVDGKGLFERFLSLIP